MSDDAPTAASADSHDLDRQQRKKRARAALKKKIATLDDEIQQSLAKTNYAKLKKQRAKDLKNVVIGLGIAAVVAVLVYLIFAPRKGGMDFALCKTFVEMRVEYPTELDFTYARRFPGNKLRMWYVHHDSFGQRQIEQLDCYFNYDNTGQIYLQKADKNRGQIDPRDIQKFNRAVPAILANPPDLTLPRGLPDDMKRFYKANEG